MFRYRRLTADSPRGWAEVDSIAVAVGRALAWGVS